MSLTIGQYLNKLQDCKTRVSERLIASNILYKCGYFPEAKCHLNSSLRMILSALHTSLAPQRNGDYSWILIDGLSNDLYKMQNEIQKQLSSIEENNFLVNSSVENDNDIFTFEHVKLCLINKEDDLSTVYIEDEALRIFRVADDHSPSGRKTFIQVGEWVTLLGLSNIERKNTLFIFPDEHSFLEGAMVGLLLRPEDVRTFSRVLEQINREECSRCTPGSSGKIISGTAAAVSTGMIYCADKVAGLIRHSTPAILNNIPVQENPMSSDVSEKALIGSVVASNVSGKAASAVGFAASKCGEYMGSFAGMVAPTVKKKLTDVVCSVSGLREDEATRKVDDVVTWTGDIIEGFSILGEGVRESCNVVGSSIATSTVQAVEHRYGEPMGQATKNCLCTVGNVYETSSNMKKIMPKSIIKNSLKETGKAVLSNKVQPLNDSEDSSTAVVLRNDGPSSSIN